MLHFRDSAQAPAGEFRLWVYRNGILVDEQIEQNLIVSGSKGVLARLIGGDFTNNNVNRIQFGTNGAAPVVGNTTITNPFTKGFDTITYPDSTSVLFGFSLGAGESNGKAIAEFGLITAAGTLFARKNRGTPINKESDLTLTGSWRIIF